MVKKYGSFACVLIFFVAAAAIIVRAYFNGFPGYGMPKMCLATGYLVAAVLMELQAILAVLVEVVEFQVQKGAVLVLAVLVLLDKVMMVLEDYSVLGLPLEVAVAAQHKLAEQTAIMMPAKRLAMDYHHQYQGLLHTMLVVEEGVVVT